MSATPNRWADKRVVIVYGGDGSERPVSLKTGRAMADALIESGVTPIEIDLRRANVRALLDAAPDAVVIALHGGDGEGGMLQGLLEYLDVPYTGSGVAGSALALDKVRSKGVFDAWRVPTPDYEILSAGAVGPPAMALPYVVKPSLEGSSVGVTICTQPGDWARAREAAAGGAGDWLVERFIDGRELTVAVFDDEVLGAIEIAAADGFYDYAAKYERGDTTYVYPAPLSDDLRARIEHVAHQAYKALGCRGIARVDVMLDADEHPWVLEVNTIPGMTATSLVPKVAAGRGIEFPELVMRLLDAATTDRAAQRGDR